jgi:hypothetical protein
MGRGRSVWSAKTGGDQPFQLRAPARRPEALLQRQVAATLRAYLPDAIWWTASLSGVTLTPALASAAKAAGMNRGAPDLSFIFPDGVTRYIELKAENGVLSTEQRGLARTLVHNMAVCRSVAEVRQRLDAWMAPYGLAFLTEAESLQREARRRAAA